MKHIADMKVQFVDSVDALVAMVDLILLSQSRTPNWYLSVDFEGVNLSRDGEICLGQFMTKGSRAVFIVDFVAIDPFALEPRLKTLLEDNNTLKVMFDPRMDADALGVLHGVILRNVLCLQLADTINFMRRGDYLPFVNGLVRVIDRCRSIPQADKQEMKRVKDAGKALFKDSFEVFKVRPLDEALVRYSALDIYWFDEIKAAFYDGLKSRWKEDVRTESAKRTNLWKSGPIISSREKARNPFLRRNRK